MTTIPPTSCACACVVLAAGASSRLGQSKQLLRTQGETLLHRTVRLAIESGFAPVCVVLGSSAEAHRIELLDCKVTIIENHAWQTGMSSSLKAGIGSILNQRADTTRHLIVLVCDQLKLSLETLSKLRAASLANPDSIIAAAYGGKLGVPAIFPHAFLPHLLTMEGDRGARVVLEQLRDQVIAVDFPEGAFDIDTLEDAANAGILEPAINLNKVVRIG